MPARPKTIDQAQALLQQDPTPEDLIEQLEDLEAKTPKDWLDRFSDFYEAAAALGAE